MNAVAAAAFAGADSRGRARIGVVTPFSNTNLEADLALLRPPGVSCHVARAGGYDLDEVPDSGQMRDFALAGLDDVLGLLTAARPDVVLYGCTSATLAMGLDYDRAFSSRIAAKAAVPAVTAAGALVEALDDIGARVVGLCSPYTEELNREAAAFLESAGRQVVRAVAPDRVLGNYGQGELTPQEVFDLGLRANRDGAEAIVMSCTDMRAVEVIEALEERTGKPVIASNQALMHCAVGRLGISWAVPGRLGRVPRAPQTSSGARASMASA